MFVKKVKVTLLLTTLLNSSLLESIPIQTLSFSVLTEAYIGCLFDHKLQSTPAEECRSVCVVRHPSEHVPVCFRSLSIPSHTFVHTLCFASTPHTGDSRIWYQGAHLFWNLEMEVTSRYGKEGRHGGDAETRWHQR